MTTLYDVREFIEEISIPQDAPRITHLFINPAVWMSLGCPSVVQVSDDGGAVVVGTDPSLPFQQARAEFVPSDGPTGPN
jgi:hypothetical protein